MWWHSFVLVCLLGFGCGGEAAVAVLDEPTSDRAIAILALVNDPSVSVEELDHGVELDVRAANGIVQYRPHESLEALDRVPFVGPVALEKLYRYALENGYLSRFEEPAEIVIPEREDVAFDATALRSVLEKFRIRDADAVITRGKVRFDDGDLYLDYEELSHAASTCKRDIYAVDGYRFAESAVQSVLDAFELEDRLALLAAATLHDEDQNSYLSLRELERARLDLTSRSE
jgi:hypothetical protein